MIPVVQELTSDCEPLTFSQACKGRLVYSNSRNFGSMYFHKKDTFVACHALIASYFCILRIASEWLPIFKGIGPTRG